MRKELYFSKHAAWSSEDLELSIYTWRMNECHMFRWIVLGHLRLREYMKYVVMNMPSLPA